MTRHSILPLRTGWEPAASDHSDYPDNLPSDWRLTYLANELRGVLVPASLWVGQPDVTLRCWRDDVHAGFRFVLEAPADLAPPAVERVRRQLDTCFGGWLLPWQVVSPVWPEGPCYLDLGADPRAIPDLGSLGSNEATGLAYWVPETARQDPRAARVWLEALATTAAGRPALALLGPESFATVHHWQSLTELLGLA